MKFFMPKSNSIEQIVNKDIYFKRYGGDNMNKGIFIFWVIFTFLMSEGKTAYASVVNTENTSRSTINQTNDKINEAHENKAAEIEGKTVYDQGDQGTIDNWQGAIWGNTLSIYDTNLTNFGIDSDGTVVSSRLLYDKCIGGQYRAFDNANNQFYFRWNTNCKSDPDGFASCLGYCNNSNFGTYITKLNVSDYNKKQLICLPTKWAYEYQWIQQGYTWTAHLGTQLCYANLKCKVTILKDQSSVVANDSTLLVGDTWDAKDNFEYATDRDGGKTSDVNKVIVSGEVNTSKPGSYTVYYSYATSKKPIKVNVIDIRTKILPNQEAHSKWSAYDGLEKVVGSDSIEHKDVDYFIKNVKVTAKNVDTQAVVDPAKLTDLPGKYNLTYTYQGKSVNCQVTVNAGRLFDQSSYPSQLDFGAEEISYEDQVYKGYNQGSIATGKVNVSDTRGTSGKGFKLEVERSDLTGESTKKVLNCTISFDTANLKTENGNSIFVDKATINLDKPNVPITVLSVEDGKSFGDTSMDLTNFRLMIPGQSSKEKDTYQGRITWNLSETP